MIFLPWAASVCARNQRAASPGVIPNPWRFCVSRPDFEGDGVDFKKMFFTKSHEGSRRKKPLTRGERPPFPGAAWCGFVDELFFFSNPLGGSDSCGNCQKN